MNVQPPTITDAWNSDDELVNLLTRAGLSRACRERLTVDEGYTTAAELSITVLKDLQAAVDNCNKLFGNLAAARRIYFPPNRIRRIKAIVVYFQRCITINQIPDIRLIDLNRINEFVLKYDAWTASSDDVDDIVKQKEIKFDSSKFKTFRDKLVTLLCAVRGARGITLEYVIRDNDAGRVPPVAIPVPDVDSNDIIAANATLHGPEFERDNSKVYTILRTILTGTKAWNVISKFANQRNGRKAFLTLKKHFQGSSYFDAMRSQANNLMTKTSYSGDRARYKWEDYVALHMEAHALYEETNEEVSESMKILNLKSGIRNDAGLENTIEAARTSATANSSFDNYVNFLTEGITSKRARAETFKNNHPRQVSTANSNQTNRGRGRGRSRRNGRGYFNGKSNGRPIKIDGTLLYPNKSYSREEFKNLTQNQRDALKKAHKNRNSTTANDEVTVASQLTNESFTSKFSDAIQSAVIMGVKRASESNNGTSDDTTTQSSSNSGHHNSGSTITNQFKRRRNGPE